MSRVMKTAELAPMIEFEPTILQKFTGFIPVIAPIVGAAILVLARLKFGQNNFLYEGSLTMLALICYISAAVVTVTNLFVKEKVLSRLALFTIAIGYCFNLSGWMMRWVEAGELEGWKAGINGVWRYFPLDTLYALTLGFCCGAALATLFIIRKQQYAFLGALSMPIVSVILTIAILFGNEIHTLMPILDSYWRPIHVSIATIAYGVCLVSFGLAFAYLLKDGIRSEAIAIVVLLYGLLIYGTVGGSISRDGVPFRAAFESHYGLAVTFMKSPLPIRADLQGVGPLMAVTLLLLVVALLLFILEWSSRDEKMRKLAWRVFAAGSVLQLAVMAVIFLQAGNTSNLINRIPQRDYPVLAEFLGKQMGAVPPKLTPTEFASFWLNQNSNNLSYSLKSNPVEIGALLSLFVCLLLVWLFAWKREAVMEAMPSLQTIDSLLYKTVGVAFPLLCMLLITGAVWANESWGRYWGWDSKETGALVATMAYAAFLHTRIAHGWRGRRSAYFALLGFALVIFTWLGVSFLLPGLHSYAQV